MKAGPPNAAVTIPTEGGVLEERTGQRIAEGQVGGAEQARGGEQHPVIRSGQETARVGMTRPTKPIGPVRATTAAVSTPAMT